MINVLEKINNFKKVEDIKSNLLYGKIEKDAIFTIVIPVFGKGKYLEETLLNIKSLLTINEPFQILISDNKEYKENNEVIDLLKKIDMNNVAYYLSEKSLGQFNNFNRAVFLAETEYIGILHDDDLLVTNYFEIVKKCLRFCKIKGNVGMIHASFEIFTNCVNTSSIEKPTIFEITPFFITHLGYSGTGIPSCGSIFNKKAFIDAGGFNDQYFASGDAFVSCIMMSNGYKIYNFNNIIGYYRIAANSSLKLNICQHFILEDEMFRGTWANGNWFRKLIMRMSANYLYSRNIDLKVKTFGKHNSEINVENLDYKKEYKCYKKINFHRILRVPGSLALKLIRRLKRKEL